MDYKQKLKDLQSEMVDLAQERQVASNQVNQLDVLIAEQSGKIKLIQEFIKDEEVKGGGNT